MIDMPCKDDGDCITVPEWMLCEALVIIENNELIGECSKDLHSWWIKHGTQEAARVKREAAAKLTPRERRVLGLDVDGKPLKNRVTGEDVKR